jgi:hypothetical protein
MKLFLKLFLALGILIAGIYLASPLWLPSILASQLPPGWQLEKVKMSWPGWSGITLRHIRLKGDLPGLTLKVVAEDSHLSYKGLATQVDSVVLDVFLSSSTDQPKQPLSIDSLSLPVLRLSAELPQVSVRAVALAIHLSADGGQNADNPAQPIVLALQGFKLSPDEDGGYHLNSAASMVGQPQVNGQFVLDVTPENISADIRFPADADSPAWLNLSVVQLPETADSNTQIQAVFDSDRAGQDWLDELLKKSTAGKLTHMGGRLEVKAGLSGANSHQLNHVTLNSQQLRFEHSDGSLLLDAEIQANRQAGLIQLTMPAEASIELLDTSGKIEAMFTAAVPELRRSPGQVAKLKLFIADNSELEIDWPAAAQSAHALSFNGDFRIDYSTDVTNIKLNAKAMDIGITDLAQSQSVSMTGAIALDWVEKKPFVYVSDSIHLNAQGLNLNTSGGLTLSPGLLEFKASGPLKAQLPNLDLTLQTGSPAQPSSINIQAADFNTDTARLSFSLVGSDTDSVLDYLFEGPLKANIAKIAVISAADPISTVITASDLSLTGRLNSKNGQIMSQGEGYLDTMQIEPMTVSASKADLKWKDLNLSTLTGQLNVKTQGFKVTIEEQLWKGFDFDLNMNLLADDVINGTGQFKFSGGPDLPVGFAGNAKSGWWDVEIKNSTIPLPRLRGILSSAHFELPAKLKLTEGSIDVAGQIELHDEITAKVNLTGSNIAGALDKSNARKASFNFDSGFLEDVFVSGPLDIENMTLAGGIDVANFHTDLDVLNSETFSLSNLSADLFDGQLKLEKLNFANGGIADTAILLNQVNLRKLLSFLDVAGLEGTGLLDFVLPTGSDAGIIRVTDGTFTSTGPGRLSYSQGGASSSNIGLQALENFHYTKLSGKIAYNAKGPYQITIRLEGSNPDLYNGYPVIFNLTINGSLPELFEAIFMTGSFEESILNQIKVKEGKVTQ